MDAAAAARLRLRLQFIQGLLPATCAISSWWHCVNPTSASVGDLAAQIISDYKLPLTDVGELLLVLDGFALQHASPIWVLRDGDLVTVYPASHPANEVGLYPAVSGLPSSRPRELPAAARQGVFQLAGQARQRPPQVQQQRRKRQRQNPASAGDPPAAPAPPAPSAGAAAGDPQLAAGAAAANGEAGGEGPAGEGEAPMVHKRSRSAIRKATKRKLRRTGVLPYVPGYKKMRAEARAEANGAAGMQQQQQQQQQKQPQPQPQLQQQSQLPGLAGAGAAGSSMLQYAAVASPLDPNSTAWAAHMMQQVAAGVGMRDAVGQQLQQRQQQLPAVAVLPGVQDTARQLQPQQQPQQVSARANHPRQQQQQSSQQKLQQQQQQSRQEQGAGRLTTATGVTATPGAQSKTAASSQPAPFKKRPPATAAAAAPRAPALPPVTTSRPIAQPQSSNSSVNSASDDSDSENDDSSSQKASSSSSASDASSSESEVSSSSASGSGSESESEGRQGDAAESSSSEESESTSGEEAGGGGSSTSETSSSDSEGVAPPSAKAGANGGHASGAGLGALPARVPSPPSDVSQGKAAMRGGRKAVMGRAAVPQASAATVSDGHQAVGPRPAQAATGTDAVRMARQRAASLPAFASLPELSGAPVVGDVFAYTLLEVSASYTPQVSEVRYGRVLDVQGTGMDAVTCITLAPWPDPAIHPLATQLAAWREQQQMEEEAQADYHDAPFVGQYREDGVLTCELGSFTSVRVAVAGERPGGGLAEKGHAAGAGAQHAAVAAAGQRQQRPGQQQQQQQQQGGAQPVSATSTPSMQAAGHLPNGTGNLASASVGAGEQEEVQLIRHCVPGLGPPRPSPLPNAVPTIGAFAELAEQLRLRRQQLAAAEAAQQAQLQQLPAGPLQGVLPVAGAGPSGGPHGPGAVPNGQQQQRENGPQMVQAPAGSSHHHKPQQEGKQEGKQGLASGTGQQQQQQVDSGGDGGEDGSNIKPRPGARRGAVGPLLRQLRSRAAAGDVMCQVALGGPSTQPPS